MKQLRILLVDDHDVVRRGMRIVIESELEWEVCGEASSGREAIEMAESLNPNVVVMDVTMPDMNGIDATRKILELNPETRVLAFTGLMSESMVHNLFAAGARGCVSKGEAGENLIPAIKTVSEGRVYLGSRSAEIVFDSYQKGGMPTISGESLTPREREIVQMLCEGASNKEVGAKLNISVKTVETHRSNIMKKLGFRGFSELVRYAVRNGIVEA